MEKILKNPAIGLLPAHLSAGNLAFPYPVSDVQFIQTHISLVFLAGDYAYKIKKPVRFLFVDYSTLEKRKSFCGREVELNRRLAPDVYLGVVPITRQGDTLLLEGDGEPVEHAVKMRRLPDENRLNRLLESNRLPENFWPNLVERLIRFYQSSAQGPEISRWAEPESLEEDWSQILSQTRGFPPDLLSRELWQKIESNFHEEWNRLLPWIESRKGRAREGHGDLRMEHVYGFPEAVPPKDLSIIDSVEFDPRYRCGDPLLDVAFLVMDLEAQGFTREANLLAYNWISQNHDEDGDLVAFYTAYRHLVRGLVRGLQAQETDMPPEERKKAGEKSRLHFRMALAKLAPPEGRPCLVLLGGLPATGKSSLARHLGTEEGFRTLSSDVIRKELAGFPPSSHSATGWGQGLYTPEWTNKTYAHILEKAGEALLQGQRVLVDASFWEQARREPFYRLAQRLRLPFLFFVCKAGAETVKERLKKSERYASDADFGVYRQMAERWQAPPADWDAVEVDTEKPFAESFKRIRQTLARHRLSRWGGP